LVTPEEQVGRAGDWNFIISLRSKKFGKVLLVLTMQKWRDKTTVIREERVSRFLLRIGHLFTSLQTQ
jgi:hypothetical protein